MLENLISLVWHKIWAEQLLSVNSAVSLSEATDHLALLELEAGQIDIGANAEITTDLDSDELYSFFL